MYKRYKSFFKRNGEWIKERLPKKLSTAEQVFFIKRLSFLICADIPLLESVQLISEQTTSKRYKKTLTIVIEKLSNGHSSRSLSFTKGAFDQFVINLINVGETTGILSENLIYLSEELKKKQSLRRKIIGACVYPVVVLVATFGIVSFLIVYLFPKIMPVFMSLHMKLPLSTRIVIVFSNAIRNYGLYILLLVIVFVALTVWSIKKYEFIRIFSDRNVLRLPFFGSLLKTYAIANATRTLGLLLKSEVSIHEALVIVAGISSNVQYKNQFLVASNVVRRGEMVSNSFRKAPYLFPEIVVQIVSVGERSGALSNSFMYLSDFYESEVENFTKNLANLIEPVLMIVMGLLVGFIAISIISPIYGITQNLHP